MQADECSRLRAADPRSRVESPPSDAGVVPGHVACVEEDRERCALPRDHTREVETRERGRRVRGDAIEAPSRFLPEHTVIDGRDNDEPNDPPTVSKWLYERVRIAGEIVDTEFVGDPGALEPNALVTR